MPTNDCDQAGAEFERPELNEIDAEHARVRAETGFWGRRAAGCIVFAQETGRILLAHRSRAVLEPNTWGTWGGAVDPGETPADTARREATEECGLPAASLLQMIPSFVFRHESGFEYHNHIAVVSQEFTPVLGWETQGWLWVAPDDLGNQLAPEDLHPGLQALIDSPLAQQQLAELVAACQLPPAPEPT